MSRKIYISFLFIFVVLTTVIYSQPPVICDNPPKMTSFCENACIICDIDGYTGRHNSNVKGWLPPDFCTTTVHNAQWIAFIAGSTNLKIELSVNNCSTSQGWGLEMTVYETRDCKTFEKVFECDGDVEENTKRVFANTKPLTVGQYYYLAMDGNGGDNCDWTFRVLEGTTQVSPLDTSGELTIPDKVCVDTDVEFLLNSPVGATEFYWSVNNNAININRNQFNYAFTQTGEYNVCVYAANACDQAAPVCKKVLVKPIPELSIERLLCGSECFVLPDTTICDAGFHQLAYALPIGCDSLVNIFIERKPMPITDLKANICVGDTIYVDETPFTTTDLFQILIDREYCDSVVNLDLKTIECNIEGNALQKNASCFQSTDGNIIFRITNGTPPFTYQVKDLSDTVLGTGNVNELNKEELISGFGKGFYLIEVADNYGNSEILLNDITEPTILTNSSLYSDYNGFNISCFDGSDGEIDVENIGGTPPYSIDWSNGISTNPLSNLQAGNYFATVTDANGCTLVKDYILTQPDALQISIEEKNPECEDPLTGIISVNYADGGIKPYGFSLVDNNFTENETFTQLQAGNYSIFIKDDNDCIHSQSVELIAPEIPDISLPEDITIELGDSTNIDAYSNLNFHKSIQWFGSYSYGCDTCLSTNYFPYKSSNAVLKLISKDDCVDIDSVSIRVINNRNVYFPNIFNSNSTINNVFALEVGKGVKDIIKLHIYDRWGNLVHKESNVNAGNHTGWDGKLSGRECEIGVYVWIAEIRYLDDTIEFFKGDITLIK